MKPYNRDQQIELMTGTRARLTAFAESSKRKRVLAAAIRARAEAGQDNE